VAGGLSCNNVGVGGDDDGGYIRSSKINLASMLLGLFAGAVAIVATGCWMMAAQLAPVAISAAETIGEGAAQVGVGVAEAVTMQTHKDEDLAHAEADMREDIRENGDSCEQLEAEAPGVIEFRKSGGGAPEYRELALGIGDSLDDAQWTPITIKGDADGGWRPAGNFLHMNFSPPLSSGLIPESSSTFLAYAQSKFISQADSDRLAAMTANFGKPAGTFTWEGQYYHYVVTSTLPCFPPPPERIAAGSAAPPDF